MSFTVAIDYESLERRILAHALAGTMVDKSLTTGRVSRGGPPEMHNLRPERIKRPMDNATFDAITPDTLADHIRRLKSERDALYVALKLNAGKGIADSVISHANQPVPA